MICSNNPKDEGCSEFYLPIHLDLSYSAPRMERPHLLSNGFYSEIVSQPEIYLTPSELDASAYMHVQDLSFSELFLTKFLHLDLGYELTLSFCF